MFCDYKIQVILALQQGLPEWVLRRAVIQKKTYNLPKNLSSLRRFIYHVTGFIKPYMYIMEVVTNIEKKVNVNQTKIF